VKKEARRSVHSVVHRRHRRAHSASCGCVDPSSRTARDNSCLFSPSPPFPLITRQCKLRAATMRIWERDIRGTNSFVTIHRRNGTCVRARRRETRTPHRDVTKQERDERRTPDHAYTEGAAASERKIRFAGMSKMSGNNAKQCVLFSNASVDVRGRTKMKSETAARRAAGSCSIFSGFT